MLHVENVDCSFDGEPVLRGVNLEVASGEIVCLLGESGSGKTTLLRIVAGLEPDYRGVVMLDGTDLKGVAVHQRGLGLMFQELALFPHMPVAENVAFGLKMRGIPSRQRMTRVQEALDLVGLSGFDKRDVTQLSGGERQRVALARSLAPEPRLLMLDEPLGALDAALRERLVVELREIIKDVGLTAVYVTHDQQEAYAIADQIAIMNRGQIEQIGQPQTLYRQPATPFVARFLGLDNIIPVVGREGQQIETALGHFTVDGEPTELLLHPDFIRIVNKHNASEITIEGNVRECVFRGDHYRMRVDVGHDLLLTLKAPSVNGHAHVGEVVIIAVDPAGVMGLCPVGAGVCE